MDTADKTPLFVDLDGTYTKTDILFECFLIAFKRNPLIIFKCFFWLRHGIANLKYELSKKADLNTSSFPINPEFEYFLRKEKEKGRKLILATASTQKFAEQISDESSLFDGFICSSKTNNLKGSRKLEKIKESSTHFSYAGNELVDFEIFSHSTESFLVNPTKRSLKKVDDLPVTKIFDYNPSTIKIWIKQFRVHQWLKNLLIFVPLVVSGQFANATSFLLVVIAFLAFSLLASATYILNDLLDLESDRLHPRKRNRPLAASTISIKNGIIASGLLFVVSALLAIAIGSSFTVVLVSYLFFTIFYSFKVKQYVGMDVVALALLYTIRIIAGAAAIGVIVSFWLFAFSIFIFLSLALVKRCSELKTMINDGKQSARGRDYNIEDYAILNSFGTSSAMLAVLMFCFYINNNVLTNQYQQPDILWLIVPGLCYWLMRMWIKTHRGEMHDDPIIFSLKDKGSLITIGLCGLTAIAAQIL